MELGFIHGRVGALFLATHEDDVLVASVATAALVILGNGQTVLVLVEVVLPEFSVLSTAGAISGRRNAPSWGRIPPDGHGTEPRMGVVDLMGRERWYCATWYT